MIKIILIVLAELYLAAVMINIIQNVRIFKHCADRFPNISVVYGTFIRFLFSPILVLRGLLASFLDWDWIKQTYIDENGHLAIKE